MVKIKYYKSKYVSKFISFKILNDVISYTFLDIRDKILTLEWRERTPFYVILWTVYLNPP